MAESESSTKKDKQEDREMESVGVREGSAHAVYLCLASHYSLWVKTITAKYRRKGTR